MHLDLITARAGSGVFVTFPARVGVEQRPEPGLGREHAVEGDFAAAEALQLLTAQAPQRISRFDWLFARRHGEHGEQPREPVRGAHGS